MVAAVTAAMNTTVATNAAEGRTVAVAGKAVFDSWIGPNLRSTIKICSLGETHNGES
jgi:hypothetical protein